MFDSLEVKFAMRAVCQAAQLVRTVQAEMISPALTKEDRSPVTVADFAAQALVAQLLAETFADQPLVGEEQAAVLREPEQHEHLRRVTEFVGRYVADVTSEQALEWIALGEAEPTDLFWTLDPVDGTKGFLRGDQYVVALAQIERGEVKVAVLGCPGLADAHRPNINEPDINGQGSLLVATPGGGTWTAPLEEASLENLAAFRRLHVSDIDDPRRARLLRSVEAAHTNMGGIGALAVELATEVEAVPMDSQAKYAVLAAGEAELLVRLLSPTRPDYREKIWDQAAGSLILEEAGGRITDLDGRSLDFSVGRTLAKNRGILATNGRLHDAALAALSRISA